MARSLSTIILEIQTNVRTNSSLNAFKFVNDPVNWPSDNGSQTSVFNLIISTVAISIYTFETILDTAKAAIQTIANSAPAGNAAWLRNQILNFQYGYSITLTNYVPGYSVIDNTAKIITQCSVKDAGNGLINIKIATGTTPPYTPLSGPQLTALQNYYNGTSSTQGIGFAGVKATFITLNPDRLYLPVNVYYYGQYTSATVQTNVISAINTFLQTFSSTAFDGRVYMDKLRVAIETVAGVSRCSFLTAATDPNLKGVQGRAQTAAFGTGTVIDIQGFYDTVAGYIISEDTGGFTLANTVNMILEV